MTLGVFLCSTDLIINWAVLNGILWGFDGVVGNYVSFTMRVYPDLCDFAFGRNFGLKVHWSWSEFGWSLLVFWGVWEKCSKPKCFFWTRCDSRLVDESVSSRIVEIGVDLTVKLFVTRWKKMNNFIVKSRMVYNVMCSSSTKKICIHPFTMIMQTYNQPNASSHTIVGKSYRVIIETNLTITITIG